MIKLSQLLPKNQIKEAVPNLPPVSFIYPPEHDKSPQAAHHSSYSKPAGQGAGEFYSNKEIDFSGENSSHKFEFSESFLKFVKDAENSIKRGYKNGKWYPYKSDDGNFMAVGYSHRLQPSDVKTANRGLSEAEVTHLLLTDLKVAKDKAENYLKTNSLQTNISQEQWEMLIDYAFNVKGNLATFPKLTRAIVTGDWLTAKREYNRSYVNPSGDRGKLSGRNAAWFNRYLSNK